MRYKVETDVSGVELQTTETFDSKEKAEDVADILHSAHGAGFVQVKEVPENDRR